MLDFGAWTGILRGGAATSAERRDDYDDYEVSIHDDFETPVEEDSHEPAPSPLVDGDNDFDDHDNDDHEECTTKNRERAPTMVSLDSTCTYSSMSSAASSVDLQANVGTHKSSLLDAAHGSSTISEDELDEVANPAHAALTATDESVEVHADSGHDQDEPNGSSSSSSDTREEEDHNDRRDTAATTSTAREALTKTEPNTATTTTTPSTTTTSSSSSSTSPIPKTSSVSFHPHVVVYEFPILMGDSIPSSSGGVPISLSWEMEGRYHAPIQDENRRRRTGPQLLIPRKQRANMLLSRGYTMKEINARIEECEAVQTLRENSANASRVWDALQLMVISARRKLTKSARKRLPSADSLSVEEGNVVEGAQITSPPKTISLPRLLLFTSCKSSSNNNQSNEDRDHSDVSYGNDDNSIIAVTPKRLPLENESNEPSPRSVAFFP